MKKKITSAICLFGALCTTTPATAQIQTNAGVQYLQCMQKDMSTDFYDLSNTYFFADSIVNFDAKKGEGLVQWKRYRMSPRQAFNLNGYWPVRLQQLDFPDAAYDNDPALRLSIEFISPRTARIRMLTTPIVPKNEDADDPMFGPVFKARFYENTGGEKVSTPAIDGQRQDHHLQDGERQHRDTEVPLQAGVEGQERKNTDADSPPDRQ